MRVVDGGMIAFAAWHALKGKVAWPLTFQVPRMLRRMIEGSADTWIVCWNGEKQWKRELWPAYRNRPEIWDEAGREDFEAMLHVLGALGVVQYRTAGLEADEGLAAIVHRFAGEEEIVIVSDDKDFMQLLSGSTRMEGRVRGTVRFSDVRGLLGVTPGYVADFLALSGDAVDGIPRILSPRTAIELIESRGHVREWMKRELRIPEGTRRRIEENRPQIAINLELVDLSFAAVKARDAPGDPLLEHFGDLVAARETGDRAGIAWLRDDGLEEDYREVLETGTRTRKRLDN